MLGLGLDRVTCSARMMTSGEGRRKRGENVRNVPGVACCLLDNWGYCLRFLILAPQWLASWEFVLSVKEDCLPFRRCCFCIVVAGGVNWRRKS